MLSLVLKLEGLASRDVNGATAVGATLLLVLLFCEALATSDGQILPSLFGVGIWDVLVRGVVVWQLTKLSERRGTSSSVLLLFGWVISGSRAGAGRTGLLNLLCSLVYGLLRIGIRGLDSFAATG